MNSSAEAMLAGSAAPSFFAAAWSGATRSICCTYSSDAIVSDTVIASPPWNAATTSSSSPPRKHREKTLSTARWASLPSTLSSLPSPAVSSSTLPLVEPLRVVRADLRAEAVLERRDDAPAVGVVLGVRARNHVEVERQAHLVAPDLDVALLHDVEQPHLDPFGEVGQLIDREDAAVG